MSSEENEDIRLEARWVRSDVSGVVGFLISKCGELVQNRMWEIPVGSTAHAANCYWGLYSTRALNPLSLKVVLGQAHALHRPLVDGMAIERRTSDPLSWKSNSRFRMTWRTGTISSESLQEYSTDERPSVRMCCFTRRNTWWSAGGQTVKAAPISLWTKHHALPAFYLNGASINPTITL